MRHSTSIPEAEGLNIQSCLGLQSSSKAQTSLQLCLSFMQNTSASRLRIVRIDCLLHRAEMWNLIWSGCSLCQVYCRWLSLLDALGGRSWECDVMDTTHVSLSEQHQMGGMGEHQKACLQASLAGPGLASLPFAAKSRLVSADGVSCSSLEHVSKIHCTNGYWKLFSHHISSSSDDRI